jgi:hypothetical protein
MCQPLRDMAAGLVATVTELQTQSVSAINAVQTWPEQDLYTSADL